MEPRSGLQDSVEKIDGTCCCLFFALSVLPRCVLLWVYCLYQFGTVFTQNLMCIVKQNIKTDKQLNVYGTAISKTDVHFQHILLQYILLKILMQNDR